MMSRPSVGAWSRNPMVRLLLRFGRWYQCGASSTERHAQLLEAPEGDVRFPAQGRRVERRPGEPGEQRIQRDRRLQTGERRPDAVMDAVAEGEMAPRGPRDVEHVG